ncbi:hypothetical protein BCR35DRAFT_329751 [Leucosporidium creatinivorum]|uniref:Uncharacterized protein n=1 Tax=Leucosporidium creatinivorum TaxID=106004 RepID=A0A1Y2FXS9_9BASI|nr:hypothetical protein BCR35DRAFT_329751 [Leucosporidium creatinivorum]
MAVDTLVLTFLTRGRTGVPGQGDELLWYTPARLRERGGGGPNGESRDHLEYVMVESLAAAPKKEGEDTALLAAHASIRENCFLDAKKDLRLVRRSKRVPWGGDSSYILAFVFRTNESYERGLDYEWAQAEAEEAGQEFFLPEGVEEEAYQLDMAMYRVVEQKLGPGLHDWVSFEHFDLHPEAMSVEFISTAFYLVIVPPSLDRALSIFASVKGSIPADVAEQALNQLFKIVSSQMGRKAFRFWAPDVPPPSTKSKMLPEGVVKYRLYCYWLDVATYHLRTCNPLLETIISASFLRTLQSIQLLGISTELTRSRYASTVLEKLAIGKILERHPPKGSFTLPKRAALNIFTLGHSPLVFGVLRSLIHYLLTVSEHPHSTIHPGVGPLTKKEEWEWLNRPEFCKITIAETRPSCSGVVLAERLHTVVEKSGDRAKELRQSSRPSGPEGLAQGIKERMKFEWGSETGSDAGEEGAYGSLQALISAVDSPNSSTKVSVEVIPDAAIVLALRSTPPSDIIVLIPAECILPGDSDIVAPTGSFVMAWCGHEVKAKVFAIASTDLISSSYKTKEPTLPPGDPAELVQGWKASSGPSLALGDEAIDSFGAKVLDKKLLTASVRSQAREIVPHKLVDAWITENGVLSGEGCALLGRERGVAEKAIYGEEGNG